MSALYWYRMSVVFHSQRYVAPVVFFLALLAILVSGGSGPLLGTYQASAVSVLACAVWITVAVVNAEDPIGRAIVIVSTSRSRDVLLAAIGVSATFCVGLIALGLAYPIMFGSQTTTWQAVALGGVAELTCASVGTGIGLLCSRLVIGRQPGVSVVAGLALVLAAILVKPLPPVYLLLQAMGANQSPASLVLPFLGYSTTGLAELAAAAAVTQFVATRLD